MASHTSPLFLLLLALPLLSLPVSSRSIATGRSHSCVILISGRVECWGSNVYGQVSTSSLAQVNADAADNPAIQIAAGRDHTCVTKADHALRCWGRNDTGQSNVPASLRPSSYRTGSYSSAHPPFGVRFITLGEKHSCAQRLNRSYECWGSNENGQLNLPNRIDGLLLLAHSSYTCVTGLGLAWTEEIQRMIPHGFNTTGGSLIACYGPAPILTTPNPPPPVSETGIPAVIQTLYSTTTDSSADLVSLYFLNRDAAGQDTAIRTMTGGKMHMCFRSGLAEIDCFGDTTWSQANVPTEAVPGTSRLYPMRCVLISSFHIFSCCVGFTGSIRCWGANTRNQLSAPRGAFSQIAVGQYHACAIRHDGSVSCWGDNSDQQALPTQRQARHDGTAHFQCAYSTCCAVALDDALEPVFQTQIILRGSSGEVIGYEPLILPPRRLTCFGQDTPIAPPPNINVVMSLSGFAEHFCGVATMLNDPAQVRRLFCFGSVSAVTDPSSMPLASAEYISVGVGASAACVISDDRNRVTCWGEPGAPQLDTTQVNALAASRGLQFDSVSLGLYIACVRFLSNEMYCWGGIAAPPESEDYLAPIQSTVNAWKNVTMIALAAYDVCALFSNHTIQCATAYPESTGFTDVSPNLQFNSVTCGYHHCCGIVRGSLYAECWGLESNGRLEAPAGFQFAELALGEHHSCGITTAGGLAVWGATDSGEAETHGVLALAAPPKHYFTNTLEEVGFYKCAGGTFSTGYGADTGLCNGLCNAGTYSANVSETASCPNTCEAGYQCPTGSSSPERCPPGTYASATGTASCITCGGVGARVLNHSTSCGLLQCEAGSEPHPNPLISECVRCTVGRYSESLSQGCDLCPPAFYAPMTGMTTCFACTSVDGLACYDGLPVVSPGYWAVLAPESSHIDDVVPCPRGACRGSLLMSRETAAGYLTIADIGINQCGDHRLNSSAMCGTCEDGFTEWVGSCVECDHPNGGLVVLFLIVSTFLVAVLHRLSQSDSGELSVLMYFIQAATIHTAPFTSITTVLFSFFGLDAEGSSQSCYLPLSDFQQLASPFFISLLFLGELLFVNMCHYAYFRFRLSEDRKLLAHTQISSSDVKALVFPWHSYRRTLLALWLTTYQPIVSASLLYFQRVNVGSTCVLFNHPSIRCDSDEYQRYLPLWSLLLAIQILTPLLLFVFLYRNRMKIKANVEAHRQRVGLIQLKEASTRRLQSNWTSKMFAFFETDHGKNTDPTAIDTALVEQFKYPYPDFDAKYGSLYAGYIPSAYWRSVWLLWRRFFLTVVDIMLCQPRDLAYKFQALALLNLFFLFTHLQSKPFQSFRDNSFESISLLVLLLLSMILSTQQPPLPTGILILVLLLVLLPLSPVAVLIVYKGYHRLREEVHVLFSSRQKPMLQSDQEMIEMDGIEKQNPLSLINHRHQQEVQLRESIKPPTVESDALEAELEARGSNDVAHSTGTLATSSSESATNGRTMTNTASSSSFDHEEETAAAPVPLREITLEHTCASPSDR